MSKKTIFYSWQSDLPNKTNRSFIQKALEGVASSVAQDETIDFELIIDHSTRGVPGSPEIAPTILKKIAKADVFVADVSTVCKINKMDKGREKVKGISSSNVMLELGYALHELKSERIVFVYNRAYGEAEELPFDIRSRRASCSYEMNEDSDGKDERKKLQDSLKRAILGSLEAVSKKECQDSFERARKYREKRIEEIKGGDVYVEPVAYGRFFSVHIVPLGGGGDNIISGSIIRDISQGKYNKEFPVFLPRIGSVDTHEINSDGVLVYRRPVGGGRIDTYTQLSKNGILEMIDTSILDGILLQGKQLKKKGLNGVRFEIPVEKIAGEAGLYINKMLRFLNSLKVSASYGVFMSFSGLRGFTVGVPQSHYQDTREIKGKDDTILIPEIIVKAGEDVSEEEMNGVLEPLRNAAGLSVY